MPLVISAAVFNFYEISVKHYRRVSFVLKVFHLFQLGPDSKESEEKLYKVFQQLADSAACDKFSLI